MYEISGSGLEDREDNVEIMKGNRNYGIDLLKIVMMFLIVCGHVIWHGSIWNRTVVYNQFSFLSEGIRFIDIIASCAVNCYAISTGYLLFNNSCDKKKLLAHWVQVETYSVLLFLIFGVATDFSIKNMISSFLPITRNQYWYFTSYFIVYLAAPYVNKLLAILNKKEFTIFIVGEILILSLIPTVAITDIFVLNRGYSPWWMIVLYTIGVYLRRFEDEILLTPKQIIVCLVLLFFATYSLEKLGELLSVTVLNEQMNVRDIIVGYTKIFTVIESLMCFIAFEKIAIQQDVLKKVIPVLSKATFGVYLFHDNMYIRKIYANVIDFVGGGTIAVGLFVIGVIIEMLRMRIAKRLKLLLNRKRVQN